MVFPKPGLQYKYKFKLPDHMRRKQMPSNRDHSKIYDLLSEEDLLDIRGPGLRKLDDEEAALFDKQKEENEKMKEAENKSKNCLPATASKKKERSSLICALKSDVRPMPKIEVEIQKDIKQEAIESVKTVTPGTKVTKVHSVIFYDDNWLSSTRPRKRKVESESTGFNFASPTLTKKALPVNLDSSKENGSEKRKYKPTKGKKEKPKKETSVKVKDPKEKACRVRGPAGGKTPLKGQVKKKRKYVKVKDQTPPALVNLMSDGKIKIRISALHAYCATAHWFISNQLQNPRLRSKIIRSSFFRQAPPPRTPPSSGEIQKKKRGPYKKRVPQSSSSISPSTPTNLKAQKTTKKEATRKPPKILTPKQALRRVRYRIEKHFADMPGKQYRCPKMSDTGLQFRANEKGKKQVSWICLVCHKEELDDEGDIMICCDGENCEDWYHLRCIGVADEKYPENMKWYCKRCMAKEVHAGTFDEKRFPLYI